MYKNDARMKRYFDKFQQKLYTILPAYVLKIYEVGGGSVVDVQIAVNFLDSRNRFQTHAPLTEIPLMFPSSSTCHITFPVKEGDTVLVYFSMRTASDFKGLSESLIQTPRLLRSHSINDAFAIPSMIQPLRAPVMDTEAVVVKTPEATVRIAENGSVEVIGKDITITNEKNKVHLSDEGNTTVESEGRIELSNENTTLHLKEDGNVDLELSKELKIHNSSGSVTLKENGDLDAKVKNIKIDNGGNILDFSTSGNASLKSSGDIKFTSGGNDLVMKRNGNIEIGKSSLEKAVLGEKLKTWLDQLLIALNAHTHSAAGSGTSPAFASIQPPQILSSKVKVE